MFDDWYVSPEEQVERALSLFNGEFQSEDVPPVPMGVDGILLLTCWLPDQGEEKGLQRTFDAWWQYIAAPDGCGKWRWSGLMSDCLRLAPGYQYRPGIRWVIFEPNAYQGKSPNQAFHAVKSRGRQLAGVEVLMALALFPAWALTWLKDGGGRPAPNLSALRLQSDTAWSVPYLGWWGDDRELKLFVTSPGNAHDEWSSPVVREP